MSEPTSWDVIIVGAGCTGHVVADGLSALADAGRRVLVIERGAQGPAIQTVAPLTADLLASSWRGAGPSPDVWWDAVAPAAEDVARAWPFLGRSAVTDVAERIAERLGGAAAEPDTEHDRLFAEGATRSGLPVRRVSARRGLVMPSWVTVWHSAEVTQVGDRSLTVRVAAAAPTGPPVGEHVVSARCVVLAAGVPGTPGLLATAPAAHAWPKVGLGVVLDPSVLVVAEHPRPIGRLIARASAFSVEAPSDGWGIVPAVATRREVADAIAGVGSESAQAVDAFARLQVVQCVAADDASAGHRGERRSDGTLRIRHRITDAVRHRLVDAQRAAVRTAFAAGAIRVYAPSAGPAALRRDAIGDVSARISAARHITGVAAMWSWHAAGGAAMGRTSRDGVTDAQGRVFGASWLRVADASLAAASPGVHPTLGVMAVADHVAAGVLADWPSLADGAAA
jgi:hypothetical protein